MKAFITSATLMFFFTPRFAKAQPNLVVNGGFDVDASGWTTNVSSGYFDALKGEPGGCFTLYGSISQAITGLTPGSSYLISGSYDVEGGALLNTPSLGVALNNVSVYKVTPVDYSWHDFSFTYIPTASSIVLTLAAELNGANTVYRIDNISMQAVPEPSAFSLLSSFILLLCSVARRRNALLK